MKQTYNNKKLVVITGCDSGIGEKLCQIFLQNDYYVIASFLKNISLKDNDKCFTKKLDLRNNNEIDEFYEFVKDICNQGFSLNGLINNAGVALLGPIESLKMETFHESFDINYFGTVNITKKLLSLIIEESGKIFIIGSLAGRISAPFSAPYSSTKYALEGFADVLRREMNPLGVKTVIIEPAAIATPIWNKIDKLDDSYFDKKYKNSVDAIRKDFVSGGNNGLSSENAALKIFNIFRKKNPKPRYIISKNLLGEYIKIAIPDILMDMIMKKIFKITYNK